MTFEEIMTIAARKGTLRWDASGTVEHLRLSKKGGVLARPVKQSKEHLIRQPDRSRIYACIEVDSVTKKPLEKRP